MSKMYSGVELLSSLSTKHNKFTFESRMVHYKNHICHNDIITKRGKIGIVDYKNHIGKTKSLRRDWKEGEYRNHRLYFCF